MKNFGTPFNSPFDLGSQEELQEPQEASYYSIRQPRQRWTRQEQLKLLDYHPIFTGRCPDCECEMPFPQHDTPLTQWNCPACGRDYTPSHSSN